jgi:hypothetical protein
MKSKAKACIGKRKYANQEEAENAKFSLIRRTRHEERAIWDSGRNVMVSYKCGHCGCWHIGHPPQLNMRYGVRNGKG